MYKILCVDDDELLRELNISYLESAFDCQIIEAGSANEAIETLGKDKSFNLILSDYDMDNGNGGDLFNFVRNNTPSIPFVLLTARGLSELPEFQIQSEVDKLSGYLQKPYNETQLIDVAKNILLSKEDINPNNEYYALAIESFFDIKNYLCDVYLKLSDEKFVKVILKNEVHPEEVLKKYKLKGVTHLYVKSSEFELFNKSNTEELVDISEQGCLAAIKTAKIHNIIKNLKISNEMKDSIDKVSNSIISELSTNDKFESLLSNMRTHGTGYMFDHCVLTSYLACSIASNMNLGSEKVLKALTMASLLHDLNFQNENACVAHDRYQMRKSDPDFNSVYLKHPQGCVDIISDFPNLPSDFPNLPEEVSAIVLNHHERPDGTGYPKSLTASSIPKLSCIFILAEEYVKFLHMYKFNDNLKQQFIHDIRKSFNKGNFKIPLEAFLKTIRA